MVQVNSKPLKGNRQGRIQKLGLRGGKARMWVGKTESGGGAKND